MYLLKEIQDWGGEHGVTDILFSVSHARCRLIARRRIRDAIKEVIEKTGLPYLSDWDAHVYQIWRINIGVEYSPLNPAPGQPKTLVEEIAAPQRLRLDNLPDDQLYLADLVELIKPPTEGEIIQSEFDGEKTS